MAPERGWPSTAGAAGKPNLPPISSWQTTKGGPFQGGRLSCMLKSKVHSTKIPGAAMSTPKYLYKYRPFNYYLIDDIWNRTTYYANPNELNDPFECRPFIENDDASDRKQLIRILHRINTTKLNIDKDMSVHIINSTIEEAHFYRYNVEGYIIERIRSAIFGYFKENGILSLSISWRNCLMWSHYADSHRGVCIEYETEGNICKELEPVSYKQNDTNTLHNTIYVSNIKDWAYCNSEFSQKEIFRTIFYCKNKRWSYEREWRDAGTRGINKSPFRKISKIYFGLNCNFNHIKTIISMFSNEKFPEFYSITKRDDKSYFLSRRLIDVSELFDDGPDEVESTDDLLELLNDDASGEN
jgi:hypothetical protein